MTLIIIREWTDTALSMCGWIPTRLWRVSFALSVALGTAAALFAGEQTSGQAKGSGSGLLVGRVIEAGTNTPVAGAAVTLGGRVAITSSSGNFTLSQAALPGGNRTTLTSSQGHFVFADVPAGIYSLQAQKAGYSPGAYGRVRPTGPLQTIEIRDATRLADLSIRMWRFATISGTVTDEVGEPVIGATVRAMRRVFENGWPQFTVVSNGMTDETDDRGSYRLGTLIPGDYLVAIGGTQTTVPLTMVEAYRRASAEGTAAELDRELALSDSPTLGSLSSGIPVGDQFFQSAAFTGRVMTPPAPTADGQLFVYPIQFYPSATAMAGANLVSVHAGDERYGIDLKLKLSPTARVSGTAVGPSGPVPNLALSLVPATSSLISDRFLETATTVADSRGAFVFLGVPAGEYTLRTQKVPAPRRPPPPPPRLQAGSTSSLLSSASGRIEPAIPEGPTLWAQLPVSVGERDVAGVAVTLRSGFRISGHVEFDGAAPRPPADAVRGLFATIEPLDGRGSLLTAGRLAIDATGTVSSYEVPAGRYLMRVRGDLPGWTFNGAVVRGQDVSDTAMDLQGPVDVTFVFTDRPSSLSGGVRTAAGDPDTAADVLAFPVAVASPEFAGSARRTLITRATRSGAYQISNLPPGDYFVVAISGEATEEFPSFTLLRSLMRYAERVTIVDGEQRSLNLTTTRVR